MSVKGLDITLNYFELFGLARQFEIDQIDLSQQYRKIQASVHPDKFANATDAERLASVQTSSLINQAYQTLREPLGRAKYILQLCGIDLSIETDTRMDHQFLMQQMELRESLENIKNNPDSLPELLDLEYGLDKQVQTVLEKISVLLNKSDIEQNKSDLDQARDLVRRLQFLSKLQIEISEKEEQILLA